MNSGFPSGLTASAIEVAIRFYWSPEACAGHQELEKLNATGLLMQNEGRRWELTARGIAFVRHILDTPLPVASWEVRRHPTSTAGPT